MKTMLNKIENAKQQKTKYKYQEQLQRKLDDALNDKSWKQDLDRQKKEEKIRTTKEKTLQVSSFHGL